MRRLAFLLPLAIIAISAALWGTYRIKVQKLIDAAPATPPALSNTLTSAAVDWKWGQNRNGKPAVQISAKGSRYLKDVGKVELVAVELKLFQKDAKHYDLVKSPKATFSQNEGKMTPDGEVEITLDVPVDGPPPHQLTSIKTTGITFDTKTGKAETDKPATFTFENGDGTCVGVWYDPDVHELHMNNQVDINLIGKGKRSKTMHVQTEKLVYQEQSSRIFLGPWSKLTRENTVVDAAGSIINMKDKLIDTIDADHAHGIDTYPKRHLNYAADMLHLTYDENGELQKMTGTGNAHLTSESKGSQTTVQAATVDMYFEPENSENVLRRTIANGNASVEAKPEPQPDGKFAETKVIHAETIELKMRPGGHELEEVESRVPSSLELLPNEINQHHRILHGAEMTILYGPQNEIQSFRSTKVTTETYPLPPPAPKPGQKTKAPSLVVAHTASDNMTAEFEPKSGKMKRMKQWGNFIYDEGERHAIGDTAYLDNDSNVMDIDKNARTWDSTGSTNGEHIKLAQNSGDFDAVGHVSTTRLPDTKKSASAMLDDSQPSQGTADHVYSANKNRLVHYEGHAIVWQTGNRTAADRIDIDRDKKMMVATDNVASEFIDEDKKDDPKDPKADPKAPASAAPPKPIDPAKPPDKAVVYTIVHATKMVYTDATRLADYNGPVLVTRPNMTVKGDKLQAFLNARDSDEDSRLNHMVADGHVEIFDKLVDRTRTSKGDHGEYYTEDSRIVIRGNDATMVDSKKGDITGLKLTYYSDDERLIVEGEPEKKAVNSHLRRKQ